jgi:lysophospholipase L1-like esterase
VAFAAYVADAHRQGWKVVVSTELHRGDFDPSQRATLAEYNRMLRQNRAGADAVVDLDTDRRMTDMALRHDPALFTPDGVHPSDGGYAVLAGMLAPAVKRVTAT